MKKSVLKWLQCMAWRGQRSRRMRVSHKDVFFDGVGAVDAPDGVGEDGGLGGCGERAIDVVGDLVVVGLEVHP